MFVPAIVGIQPLIFIRKLDSSFLWNDRGGKIAYADINHPLSCLCQRKMESIILFSVMPAEAGIQIIKIIDHKDLPIQDYLVQ